MKIISRILFLVCVLSMLLSTVSCAAIYKGDKNSIDNTADAESNGSYKPSAPGDSVAPDYGYTGDGSTYPGTPDYDDGFKGEIDEGGAIPPATGDGLYGEDSPEYAPDYPEGGGEDVVVPEPDQIVLPSGMITAGAWVDNDNYKMWLELFTKGQTEAGKFYEYIEQDNTWGFNSLKRVKVNVTCDGNAVAGARVVASDEAGIPLFSAVSDAKGDAYIFTDADNGNITVTSGEGSADASFTEDRREISVELSARAEKLNVIEIMLVVDVTGSMGDEIRFLKAELADVINKIAQNNEGAIIKLAMLFYRDTDDYEPFVYYDFTNVSEAGGLSLQQDALNKQFASGGGDYPEAVDEALMMAVDKQWSTGATTKLIFHVLDAPAHEGAKYEEKFKNAVNSAAEKGIRICPILCSGAAELTEYTMRQAAIYTGGTFIFVTDDSGIGGSHHDPGLPNATIELLNSLMVRLVNGYHTGEFAPAIYWKEDPGLNIKN